MPLALSAKESRFETMVRAYSGDLYRVAYWLCRDRSRAEDLVQETFMRAWAASQSLRDDKAAKSWLLTILRREHARLYERKPLEIEERELDELVGTSNAYAELEMREAMNMLPVAYREPLLLQAIYGFSGAEIARIMSLTDANVMTRLTRARQALRKLIEPRGRSKLEKVK